MTGPQSSTVSKPEASPDWAWFCLRAQQRHEHIAANCLRQMEQVEVFCPRIRFQQPRSYGKVWITEPLFPSYLFARFNWKDSLCRVQYAPGVQNVVHFGNGWPTIPAEVIEEIRVMMGRDELRVISDALAPGDEVEILGGLFEGLRVVVTQVMPGGKRVAVLMNFLGRQTTVQISTQAVIKPVLRR